VCLLLVAGKELVLAGMTELAAEQGLAVLLLAVSGSPEALHCLALTDSAL
jgi:hypothetical protein